MITLSAQYTNEKEYIVINIKLKSAHRVVVNLLKNEKKNQLKEKLMNMPYIYKRCIEIKI